MSKMPTKWRVPAGWVLTWYPPFEFPYPVDADRAIFVYDEDEPFVPADGAGDGGYNPNGEWSTLDEYDGVHPGQYALNVQGDEPTEIAADAIQTYGKKVTA